MSTRNRIHVKLSSMLVVAGLGLVLGACGTGDEVVASIEQPNGNQIAFIQTLTGDVYAIETCAPGQPPALTPALLSLDAVTLYQTLRPGFPVPPRVREPLAPRPGPPHPAAN